MTKVKKITYDEMLFILEEKFPFDKYKIDMFKKRWYDGSFVIYLRGANQEQIDTIQEIIKPYRTTAGSRFYIAYPAR